MFSFNNFIYRVKITTELAVLAGIYLVRLSVLGPLLKSFFNTNNGTNRNSDHLLNKIYVHMNLYSYHDLPMYDGNHENFVEISIISRTSYRLEYKIFGGQIKLI